MSAQGNAEHESFQAAEEALLEATREKTGLSEFGGGPWREGLRVLLRAYDEEARCTPAARTRGFSS